MSVIETKGTTIFGGEHCVHGYPPHVPCSLCAALLTTPPTQKPEYVNHPAHYGGDVTYEAIKVIEAWDLTFNTGNAAKYICRAGKKSPDRHIEDLEKAREYLRFEIERLKRIQK